MNRRDYLFYKLRSTEKGTEYIDGEEEKKKEHNIQVVCSGKDTHSEISSTRAAGGTKSNRKSVRIEVRCGLIENMEADGLVCTMPSDLNLYKGGASLALSVAAGWELQDELNNKRFFPNQLEYGEVAVVGGHRLKCKYVLLGVITKYEPKYDEHKEGPDRYHAFIVRDFMVQCLRKADELGLTSLAFPAVGYGNLKFPVDIVADEMFQAVKDHGENYPTSQIKQVTFVIFPEDEEAILVFQEKENKELFDRTWCLDEDRL